MSRIGKKPVVIPDGVKVELKGRRLKVSGPKGEQQLQCHPLVKVRLNEQCNEVHVINEKPDVGRNREMHGTMRALISNMVVGVSSGFERKMEIYGTGYSVKEQGGKLFLNVGYSKPVELKLPEGIKVNIEVAATRGNEVPAKFTISGVDKHLLGQVAANIRRTRPPEPYKGKGIRYADEHVRRKVGKALAAGGA